MLYPTLYEGFGLVPFEAAALGTPAVYSSRSSLGEFLPADGALLDGWDVQSITPQLLGLLTDEQRAERLVRALRRAAEPLTWHRTAESYLDVYRRVMSSPVGMSLVIGGNFTIQPRETAAATRGEQRLLTMYRRISSDRGCWNCRRSVVSKTRN